jgi:hypothetical protein
MLNGTPLFGIKLEDIIKMDVREISCEAMYWIHLAQECIRWQSPVEMVIKIWFHKTPENSRAPE